MLSRPVLLKRHFDGPAQGKGVEQAFLHRASQCPPDEPTIESQLHPVTLPERVLGKDPVGLVVHDDNAVLLFKDAVGYALDGGAVLPQPGIGRPASSSSPITARKRYSRHTCRAPAMRR